MSVCLLSFFLLNLHDFYILRTLVYHCRKIYRSKSMLGLGRDIRSRYRNCFLNDELTSRLMKHDNIIKTITNDRILFDCRIWYIVLLRELFERFSILRFLLQHLFIFPIPCSRNAKLFLIESFTEYVTFTRL